MCNGACYMLQWWVSRSTNTSQHQGRKTHSPGKSKTIHAATKKNYRRWLSVWYYVRTWKKKVPKNRRKHKTVRPPLALNGRSIRYLGWPSVWPCRCPAPASACRLTRGTWRPWAARTPAGTWSAGRRPRPPCAWRWESPLSCTCSRRTTGWTPLWEKREAGTPRYFTFSELKYVVPATLMMAKWGSVH